MMYYITWLDRNGDIKAYSDSSVVRTAKIVKYILSQGTDKNIQVINGYEVDIEDLLKFAREEN